MNERKNNNGQFQKNNEIGKSTRFQKRNAAAVKYKDEYCENLLSFFAEQEREIVYEREYYKDGTLKKETPKIVLPTKYPTFEKFATSIGVTAQTLLNWTEKHPRFLSAYAHAKDMQLAIIKGNAITKNYDASFAKFLLVNEYGMSDRVVQEQTQEKPFEVNIRVIKK